MRPSFLFPFFSNVTNIAGVGDKTAKLLTAPLLISSIFAGEKYYEELVEYGLNLGVMFQITDDIMDAEGDKNYIGKTPNKDQAQDKLTSIKILGLEGAKEKLEYHYNKCLNVLNSFENNQFLLDFTKKMFERTK